MSEPRYIVDRRLDAPANAVLAAIGEAISATRRADLPAPLRRGVHGLTGKVRGTRFTVGFDASGDGIGVDLRGAVLPAEGGATRVHASAMEDRFGGATVAGLLVIAALVWLIGGEGAGWIVVMAALLGVMMLVVRGAGWTDDARATYLAEWLNGVLDRFPAASPAPPASTDDASTEPVRVS